MYDVPKPSNRVVMSDHDSAIVAAAMSAMEKYTRCVRAHGEDSPPRLRPSWVRAPCKSKIEHFHRAVVAHLDV
jgi:hypothetical protein